MNAQLSRYILTFFALHARQHTHRRDRVPLLVQLRDQQAVWYRFSIPTRRSCGLQTPASSSLPMITIDRRRPSIAEDHRSTHSAIYPPCIVLQTLHLFTNIKKRLQTPSSFLSSQNRRGENTQATTEAIAQSLSVTHLVRDVSTRLCTRYRSACILARRVLDSGFRNCSSIIQMNHIWDVELGLSPFLHFCSFF